MDLEVRIEGCLIGLAVGDALGVPVEFQTREDLRRHPVTDMRGFGTWHQPPGTWSDDSSLAFCTAESLSNNYDLADIGRLFSKWMSEGYWGAHHKVFDVGGTTRSSISRLEPDERPIYSGDTHEDSNGNGSLMRIAPASIYFHRLKDTDLLERMREISGITHAHFVSIFSCFILSKIIQKVISGSDKLSSYQATIRDINTFAKAPNVFKRTLDGSLLSADEDSIRSSGYVVHTLEASLWCFLNTDSYQAAVLKAVNLGDDTDTIACVTGALAGLYYGPHAIGENWKTTIARVEDIRSLATKFAAAIPQHPT